MGACPERIVSFKDYSVDMIGSMIKSMEVPDEGLRIIALACENDAYPALDSAADKQETASSECKVYTCKVSRVNKSCLGCGCVLKGH